LIVWPNKFKSKFANFKRRIQAFDEFDLIYFSFDTHVDKMKTISVVKLITKLFSIILIYVVASDQKRCGRPITSQANHFVVLIL